VRTYDPTTSPLSNSRMGPDVRRALTLRAVFDSQPARDQRPRFRSASLQDAEAIAALHADSWRRHYRGAYSDAFLDGDVHGDRLILWTERLREAGPRTQTIVADDGDGLVGFAHTVFEADPHWGALLDNLHVVPGEKRRGIGSRLLALTAQAVLPVGARAERRWSGVLRRPRRAVRGAGAGSASRRGGRQAQRLPGRAALRLA